MLRRPLVNLATIVTLIGETTTDAGRRVRSEIDDGHYPNAVKITDDQIAQLQLHPHAFHAEWNYTLQPRVRKYQAVTQFSSQTRSAPKRQQSLNRDSSEARLTAS